MIRGPKAEANMARRGEKTFEFGDVIGKTFEVWLKNFVPFAVITLVVHSPMLVVTFLMEDAPPEDALKLSLLVIVLSLTLGSVASGALTYGVLQALRGRAVAVGECISTGFARLLPVLWVSILVGVCIVLGFLLVVPGFIFLSMLAVAVPVAVVEKPGATTAMGRSATLTKGFRWPVLFVVLVLVALGWGLNTVLEIPTATLGVAGSLISLVLVTVVSSAVQAAAPAVMYQRLRDVKEGASVEDLAKVFD
jgi:hypothetical protein